ncbi:MAG: glycosyltransferase family 2 protein [Candidatus Omnitrophica bacterium]|nr:glycosyltransferase family 2 protein [Candidatus Omnitrophota bacterium]
MDQLAEISAFFPAYNEERNLSRMVTALRQVLSEVSRRYEIIIVDDGSADGTKALAEKLALQYPEVRVVHHPKNLGYGAAIRSGIRASRYSVIFFTDGDCQFDVREICQLLPHIHSYDIVTGYRQKRADPFARWLYSRGWNLAIRLLLGVKVKDLNCAFKMFKAEGVKTLPLKSTGALINAEILYYAQKKGLHVCEVPVRHYPRPAGNQTGGNPRVILRAFRELFQLLLNRS